MDATQKKEEVMVPFDRVEHKHIQKGVWTIVGQAAHSSSSSSENAEGKNITLSPISDTPKKTEEKPGSEKRKSRSPDKGKERKTLRSHEGYSHQVSAANHAIFEFGNLNTI